MKRESAREATVTITVDGQERSVPAGCSVAVALLLCGVDHTRTTTLGGEPRGVFCGMGSCFDCVATIDGRSSQRTCITEAVDGMRVETGPKGVA